MEDKLLKSFPEESQYFRIRSVSTVNKKADLSNLKKLIGSFSLVFLDIANIKDPCLICYSLGLIHTNKIPILFMSSQEKNFKFKLECQKKDSISKIFDFYIGKIDISLLFRDNIQKLFYILNRYFQGFTTAQELMQKIYEKEQVIREVKSDMKKADERHDEEEKFRLKGEISRYYAELNETEDKLNRAILSGMISLFSSIKEYLEFKKEGIEKEIKTEENFKFKKAKI